MALKRAPGTPRPDLNHIAFPMEDVATGKVVSCTVSEDALRKMSGGGSSIASMEAMFEQHRDYVEGIASNKYDGGQSSPRVLENDV